jgi:N-acetylglutamate synthase-like GNAT family acetyltransferase
MLSLRTANKSEMAWINCCYDDLGFVHSDFNREIIAIAEYEGQKAGLGRLVTIDENNFELGGMYVFNQYRDKGIAKEIVRFLLNHVECLQTVYCIPFQHLTHFYAGCGFEMCVQREQVPKEILEKFHWCKGKYPSPTSLMVKKR